MKNNLKVGELTLMIIGLRNSWAYSNTFGFLPVPSLLSGESTTEGGNMIFDPQPRLLAGPIAVTQGSFSSSNISGSFTEWVLTYNPVAPLFNFIAAMELLSHSVPI